MPVSQQNVKRLNRCAKPQLADCKGKLFNYRLIDCSPEPVSGVCTIEDITYDKLFNCDIYTIKDVETKVSYIIDFFHILVEEKKD